MLLIYLLTTEDESFRVKLKMGFQGAKNGSEWSGRKEDQPFFKQIQLSGGKFGNPPKVIKSEQVTVLAYYPDHTVYREYTL